MRYGLTLVRVSADERPECDHSAKASAIATAPYRRQRSTPRGHTTITARQWRQRYRRITMLPTRGSLE